MCTYWVLVTVQSKCFCFDVWKRQNVILYYRRLAFVTNDVDNPNRIDQLTPYCICNYSNNCFCRICARQSAPNASWKKNNLEIIFLLKSIYRKHNPNGVYIILNFNKYEDWINLHVPGRMAANIQLNLNWCTAILIGCNNKNVFLLTCNIYLVER